MIPSTLLFALLAAPCALVQAQAQAPFTLDGHINLGLLKESGRSAELGRGYNNWLRLKSSEPLGDGMLAGAVLEMRYKPDTGAAETGALFQGESTVGLGDTRHGTLRLGRAMSPLWQQKWRFEPWFDSEFMGSLGAYQSGSYTSDPGAALGYANWARIPGAVFFDSASVAGFSLHLAGALSPSAGAAGKTHGGALNYAGDLHAGMVSFEKNNRGDTIWYAAGSWTLTAVTLMASATRVRLAAGPEPEHSYVLAARCDLAVGALRFGAGYTGHPGSARKRSAGYIIALSKRTSLYADLYRETAQATLRGAALGMAHMF
jgi:predicted porin